MSFASDLKSIVRDHTPAPVHSLAITAYNTRQYRQRHGGEYRRWRDYYQRWQLAPEEAWRQEQNRRLREFLNYIHDRSLYYAEVLGKHQVQELDDLAALPLLTKDDLRRNAARIQTVTEKGAIVNYTGGTTGASLKVLYLPSDVQERHAVLDTFRAGYGHSLGRRTAWFSGKELLSDRDVRRGRFYKDDYRNSIRFFSTFHVNEGNFDAYWKALESFSPEFIVGFPSSVYGMCLPAYQRGRTLRRPINTYFPTAETVLPEHLEVINTVLGGRTKNQYASSEGAPFILECHHGNLHLHPLTGVFEVLEDEPSASEVCGELVVTAFATRGTPLVRYRVGDRIRIDSGLSGCDCGSTFPIVASIEGRTNDVLDSPFTGQCNLGNLSNCTKGVAGISHFQAIQERLDAVEIRVVTDQSFDRAQEKRFLDALHLRLGAGMTIELIRVDEIAREKSGKLKMIKNRLREGSDWTGG